MASPARLAEVAAAAARVFGTVQNPLNVRTGAKFLKRTLKGPIQSEYYVPNDVPLIYDIRKTFEEKYRPAMKDASDQHHLMMNAQRKKRGKGKPKKKSEKVETKKKK